MSPPSLCVSHHALLPCSRPFALFSPVRRCLLVAILIARGLVLPHVLGASSGPSFTFCAHCLLSVESLSLFLLPRSASAFQTFLRALMCAPQPLIGSLFAPSVLVVCLPHDALRVPASCTSCTCWARLKFGLCVCVLAVASCTVPARSLRYPGRFRPFVPLRVWRSV